MLPKGPTIFHTPENAKKVLFKAPETAKKFERFLMADRAGSVSLDVQTIYERMSQISKVGTSKSHGS